MDPVVAKIRGGPYFGLSRPGAGPIRGPIYLILRPKIKKVHYGVAKFRRVQRWCRQISKAAMWCRQISKGGTSKNPLKNIRFHWEMSTFLKNGKWSIWCRQISKGAKIVSPNFEGKMPNRVSPNCQGKKKSFGSKICPPRAWRDSMVARRSGPAPLPFGDGRILVQRLDCHCKHRCARMGHHQYSPRKTIGLRAILQVGKSVPPRDKKSHLGGCFGFVVFFLHCPRKCFFFMFFFSGVLKFAR